MKKITLLLLTLSNLTFASTKISETSKSSIFKVLKKHYPELVITVKNSEKHNAYATWSKQEKPEIILTTSVFNNKFMDTDVLALLLCHELGHFYGNSPKQRRGRSQKRSWSSAEGQADFYATSICMKKILKDLPIIDVTDTNKMALTIPMSCIDNSCLRILNASMGLAKIFAKIKMWHHELSYTRKDFSTAYSTIYAHPNPQCRLDTLIAGLLCSESLTVNMGEQKYTTCKDIEYRQPHCWIAPTVFEDI